MNSAPVMLPPEPPGGLTSGLDWACDDHAVAVVDASGTTIDRFMVMNSTPDLRHLATRLTRAGVTETAIERPDGPVVDALLEAGITVVVIPPGQVAHLRSRYGSAGNKDDRFDAFVLADTLRTDRARLRPLVPDSPQTTALRHTCRTRRDLVISRVAATNQLRAHLQRVLPGAVNLFCKLDSAISLRFLARFTTQEQVDWLTPTRLATWLRRHHYPGRQSPESLHAKLLTAPRGLTGPAAASAAIITGCYLATITALVEQIHVLDLSIRDQLAVHPDAPIFTSLPRSGTLRAARLLAEIGDCRGRFPTPASLACLAGVAPTTRQSGKTRVVSFRWSADKQLRDAVTDFAGDSRHANPWAAHLYEQARARGHDHPHAVRILARAWLFVIWHCWQNHTPYDPGQHNALQRLQHPHDIAA